MTKALPAAASDPAAALAFPQPTPPAPGTVLEVAPGVLWLRMPLPFALDHINLWLIREADGWAAVDCGIGLDETRALWDQVLAQALGGAPLTRVVVTHFHPDHFGNARWLSERFGVRLHMSQGEYLTAHAQYHAHSGYGGEATAELFAAHGLPADQVAAMSARGNGYRKIVGEPPLHYVRMLEDDELVIGERRWRVIVGHGHAPEHVSLYCETLGVLISGDMLLPRISTNVSVWAVDPLGDPLRRFLQSIDRFAALPADVLVLPSHGLPFRGARPRVAMLHRHHADRLGEVELACATPATAAELLPVLFRRALDTHQTFFAMGESIAHLNQLWHRGRLRRIEGADRLIRFGRNA
jgi:glyoxylase-like metal-dependent hydrolase (beta-lactamase superfamily II)